MHSVKEKSNTELPQCLQPFVKFQVVYFTGIMLDE